MYLWVAVNVNEQVRELREKAESYARKKSLDSSTFTLPFHISLKISFQVSDDRYDEAVSDIRDFFKTWKPFRIKVKGMEQNCPIVWILMQESMELTDIHKKLDEMLYEKYGVVQHEYDKNFMFHTTVYMISDQEELKKAFDEVKNFKLPEFLKAESFVIGSSVDGVPGTYHVIEEIQIR